MTLLYKMTIVIFQKKVNRPDQKKPLIQRINIVMNQLNPLSMNLGNTHKRH